jgi:anti-anti-sigma factor
MNADAPAPEPDAVAAGFEQLPLFLVVTEGPDLMIRAMNAAARAVSPGRGVGARYGRAFPDHAAFGVEAVLERVYRTGVPRTVLPPGWLTTSNGQGKAAEAGAGLRVAPWRDADGAVGGLLIFESPPNGSPNGGPPARGEAARPAEIATALQEALLPVELPVLPGLDLAACYLPAGQEAAAGGDWFDAIVLPGGRTALVVGDVVGHGVEAAAVMSRLRSVLSERLLYGEGCAQAVAAAGRCTRAQPGAIAATVCVAIVHPDSGALVYTTAGHPPPLIVGADHATTQFLEPTGDGPLTPAASFTERTGRIPPGATILLYSDGIIEGPGLSPMQGMLELARTAAGAAANWPLSLDGLDRVAQRVCLLSVEAHARSAVPIDDITALAATRIAVPRELDVTVPTDTEQLAVLRLEIGLWLLELGADPADESNMQHAVGELITNVIEHAYAGHPMDAARPVRLRGRLADDGCAVITVSDEGVWRTPNTNHRYHGFGLTMAANLLDELTVGHDEHGTTARARHRLYRRTRTPVLQAAPAGRAEAPATGFELHQRPDRQGWLEVSGVLDASTAGSLRTNLRRASANTTRPLTVDLSGVTYLGSTAVQVLLILHDQAADHGVDITLRAPAGSVADHVLTLVALPHHGTDPDTP